jgi:hypothetical protein
MKQNRKTQVLIIFIILLIFPLYFLSDNVVYDNKHYILYITVLAILSFFILLMTNQTLRLIIKEKYEFKNKKSKLLKKDILILKLHYYAQKVGIFLGLLMLIFYIYYSTLNFTIYLFSLNKTVYYENVRINKLEMYRNNMKYQFFFKNELISKRTEMNNFNRDVLDGKVNLKGYMILIKYRKSIFNSYFIDEKTLIPATRSIQ